MTPRSFDLSQASEYPRVEGRRERCAKRISTIPRRWKTFGEPRTVILHKGKKGFGFVLRGAKASSPLMERETNDVWPSQYLEDVGKGGVADLAGLKKGDYLLEINGQDVSQASHEHVVSIIQQSGNLVAMTVITARNPPFGTPTENPSLPYRQCATLPRKFICKKAPAPPKRDPKTTLSVGRVRARSMVAGLAEIETLDRTLCEYDSEGRSTKSSSVESIPNKTGLKMSDCHLTKTASIKARPSSQRVSAAELEQFFARQGSKKHIRSYTLNNRPRLGSRPPKVYGSVAEMKRSKASRSKLTETTMKVHKDFFSTPDLKEIPTGTNNQNFRKRSLSQEDVHNIQGSRHSWACTSNGYNSYLGLCDNEDYSLNYNEAWKSIEDVYDSTIPVEVGDTNSDIYAQTLPLTKKEKVLRASCPPPSHPPPPPPVGQVVKVDVSKSLGDYANVNIMDDERNSNVMSSFRPGDSAKLYASPEVVMSVGYKSDTVSTPKDTLQPRRAGGGSSLRSQSLPPKIPGNKSDRGSTTSSEAENSGDSGGLYSTFKKTSRQRDSMSTDSGHVSDRGAFWSLKGKSAVTSAYASKFDFEDSDAGSPQNYPTVRTPSHEPFIPEPDYESSEDDFIPTSVDKGASLSTFGKGDVSGQEEKLPCQSSSCDKEQVQSETNLPLSPHTEAKRAIQEARERLRFSQKPIDKNATVVFISGKITEHKVEKSEIQLHRTEEGRLTGTVVISTTNEPQDSCYLSSSILKSFENEKCVIPRYPSRDAPASEYAKYRQQILSGMNQTKGSVAESVSAVPEHDQKDNKDVDVSVSTITDTADTEKSTKNTPADGLKITLTGSQKCSSESKSNMESRKEVEKQNCSKNDNMEHSSVEIASVTDIQTDQVILSSSVGDANKAEGSVQLSSEPDKRYVNQDTQSRENKQPEKVHDLNNEELSKFSSQVEAWNRKNLKSNAESMPSDLLGTQKIHVEAKSNVSQDNKTLLNESCINVIKSAQKREEKNVPLCSSEEVVKNFTDTKKAQSSTESSLDESLEVLRLQVNSLGLAAINEVDVFTELVPPPPEFAASSENAVSKREASYSASEIAIAPPPEFSDNSPHSRNRVFQRVPSNHYQRKNYPLTCHHDSSSNSVDLTFLASLENKSPKIVQMMRADKKCNLGSSSGTINVHSPCTSGLRHLPSNNISEHAFLHESSSGELSRLKSVQKEFRFKLLQEWTANDIADWLDSLFLPEYKQRFSEAGITGAKLANMDSNDLMGLGVKQMGHRLNMERSLKRYLK
ncbi:SH3 and multiple ankyrin repeat domains protein 1, partial [Stegodyphus mimosarum]